MNFVTVLPRSPKGNNAIGVITDRLTKSANFVPFKVRKSTKILAERYMQEVVRPYGVPVSVMSDRDCNPLIPGVRITVSVLDTTYKIDLTLVRVSRFQFQIVFFNTIL